MAVGSAKTQSVVSGAWLAHRKVGINMDEITDSVALHKMQVIVERLDFLTEPQRVAMALIIACHYGRERGIGMEPGAALLVATGKTEAYFAQEKGDG